MRWVKNVEYTWEMRNASSILAVEPEGRSLLMRRSRRWVDNIKADLKGSRRGRELDSTASDDY
jgi:hypothetical protein